MGNGSVGGSKKDSSTLAIAETDNSLSRLYFVKKGFKSKIVSNVQKVPTGEAPPVEIDDKTDTEGRNEGQGGNIIDPSKKVKEVNRVFKKHKDILQDGYFVVNPSRKYVLPKKKDCDNVYWVTPSKEHEKKLKGGRKEIFTPITPHSPARMYEQDDVDEDLVNTIEEELYRQAGYIVETGNSGRIEFTEVMSNPLLSSLQVIKSPKEQAEEEIEDFRERMKKRREEEEKNKSESRRFVHTNPLFGGYESTSSDGEGVTTETDGLLTKDDKEEKEGEEEEEEVEGEEVEDDVIVGDEEEGESSLPIEPNVSMILPLKEEEEVFDGEVVVIKEEDE